MLETLFFGIVLSGFPGFVIGKRLTSRHDTRLAVFVSKNHILAQSRLAAQEILEFLLAQT